MIIREYINKDSENRDRIFVEVKCEICKSIFNRQKRFLSTHTCSASCRNILNGVSIITKCGTCDKEIKVSKSRIKSINYCSRKCKDLSQATGYRLLAFKTYGEVCNRCGFNNVKALEVHHIDRDRTNNLIDNLEVLCCNCHSIEHRGT